MPSSIPLKSSDPNARLTEALCISLRRRQIIGSRNVALATAALVQNIVRSVKFNTIEELIAIIKAVGRKLVEANPKELAAGNIIRRILRLIREEYRAALPTHLSQSTSFPSTPFLEPQTPGIHPPNNHYLNNDHFFTSPSSSPNSQNQNQPLPRQASLSNFVAMRHSRAQLDRVGSTLDLSLSVATSSLFMTPGPTRGNSTDTFSPSPMSGSGILEDPEVVVGIGSGGGSGGMRLESGEEFARHAGRLKPILIQAIEEVVGELETTHEDVAKGAREHIHSSEIILTLGYSKTVEAFLKQAYRDRKFTVIVAESAPSFLGHSMAKSLSLSSIPTILLPDSSLHAIMPRITKLILGAHSVLANGGLFALSGSLSAVLAARAHAKPVVITTGQFKFAPAWNLYHEFGAVDFQSPGAVLGYDVGVEGVEAGGNYYDYIRPELINLFVTNEGDHSPSYIYRIIREAYDDEDIEL